LSEDRCVQDLHFVAIGVSWRCLGVAAPAAECGIGDVSGRVIMRVMCSNIVYPEASSSALSSRPTKSATRPDSTPHRSRRPHGTVISISGQTSFELTRPIDGPWREYGGRGPSILASIAASNTRARLERPAGTRSWRWTGAPAGGRERATERAAPTRFPRAFPACPYSFFCQSLWMC